MTVRAWLARPESFDMATLLPTLGQAEKTKADRFRFVADRNAFVLSHALQRAQLSQTLNIPPYDLQFGRTAKGRPMLTHQKAENLAFSASRRREVVVYAQAAISQLGIDVEKIVAIENPEALLAKFLDSTSIALLSGSDKHRTFTRLWTITEACAKARGTGLATFSPRFSVSLDSAELALVKDGDTVWRCHTIQADPDHQITIAYANPHWLPIEMQDWTGPQG